MTNEELATQIRAGNDRKEELWHNLRRFVVREAVRNYGGTNPAFDVDDLIQSGFFAMLSALDKWDESKGAFIKIFSYELRREFRNVAGLRTERQRQEPLNNYASINAPLDDDGATLQELIDSGDTGIQNAEERIYNDQLRETLSKALDTLKERERGVLERYYFREMSKTEIAKEYGIVKQGVNQAEDKALRRLRTGKYRQLLYELYCGEINAYKGAGFGSWSRTGNSVQQHILEQAEWMHRHRCI